jgi:hypothetical protein
MPIICQKRFLNVCIVFNNKVWIFLLKWELVSQQFGEFSVNICWLIFHIFLDLSPTIYYIAFEYMGYYIGWF